jgi:hypothetical protein
MVVRMKDASNGMRMLFPLSNQRWDVSTIIYHSPTQSRDLE